MLRLYPICFLLLFFGLSLSLSAQDDLLDLLEDMEEETTEYTYATFKTVRIINGHSIETPAPGVMQLIISHRFGRINGGAYEFFGLDQANMRLGFEYGISNRLCVGIGRSNIQKTYDSFVKFILVRQSSGKRVMPVSLAYLGNTAVNTLRWADPSRTNYFSSRLSFTHQLLLARKFSDRLSLQLMPTLVHRNLVETAAEKNSVFAIGAGGRVRLTGSLTVNFEYFYVLPDQLAPGMQNSAAIGFDIETGGHVFQLMFTNSRGMSESLFITQTDGKIDAGDIHFGFNLARVFTVSRKKPKKDAW